MSLKNIRREYRESERKELRVAAVENFVYGLLGSILVVFIAQRMDVMVLLAYMTYYFYVGKVINRPKYVTSLGKFIMFPVPAALGAFTGYKLAYLLSAFI
tara:strand:- start:2512 stop:2811 length:300 start_codon:yes stop_codon:yes gene_type:complete